MNDQDEVRDENVRADEDWQTEAPEEGRPAKVSNAPQPEERPPGEEQAEIDLLKSSGGDPFTQEND